MGVETTTCPRWEWPSISRSYEVGPGDWVSCPLFPWEYILVFIGVYAIVVWALMRKLEAIQNGA